MKKACDIEVITAQIANFGAKQINKSKMKKPFLHLSELQFFAKRDTIIVLNDNSFIGTFSSAFEAKEYAIKKKLQYKEIVNECIIEKY